MDANLLIAPCITDLVTATPLAIAGENFLADRNTLLHLVKRIQVRPVVFIFDVTGKLPMMVSDEAQHGSQGSIAFAPGKIRPVVPLPILEVQCDDPAVPFAEKGNGILIRRHEVSDVQIDSHPI